MNTVTIARNPFEPKSWTTRDGIRNVCGYLTEEFGDKFPATARIYHEQVAVGFDVTPSDEASIKKLQKLRGNFFVVVYPNDPATLVIAAIGIAIALTATAFFLMPKIPAAPNTQAASTNNSLGDRQNAARLNGRIPDIVGTVRATPDLVQVPYRIFDSNSQEIELAYMCISRGELDVDANNVFDGTTPINQINGESVEIYGPGTSPNGGSPQLTIGTSIATGIINVTKSNSVNGQTLYAPNYKKIQYPPVNVVEFQYQTGPNGAILSTDTTVCDFTKFAEVGDTCLLTTGDYVNGSTHTVLSGSYVVHDVTSNNIGLTTPASINAAWTNLNGYAGHKTTLHGGTGLVEPIMDFSDGLGGSVGQFFLNDPTLTGAILNFVALNGLYKTNGSENLQFAITIRVGVTPADATGAATGPEVTTDFVMPTSAIDHSQKALSAVVTLAGRSLIRATRMTDADYTYAGQVQDKVQWRDLYGISPVTQTDFGNVTTIQTKTFVTPSSLGVQERKINLICTRKVPIRISGSTFGATTGTNRADDIMAFLCLDPYIGNRPTSQINFDSLYDTVSAVEDCFGIEQAVEFNHSFDEDDISFEETIQTISSAIFCQAYRRGSTVNWLIEQATNDSTLLFNHRNKLPKSETRTYTFGNQSDYDGVAYDYIDPTDESTQTFYLPNEDVVNPQQVQSVGIRSKLQAYWQANRLWNKIRYQHIAVEFTATQQADLLVQLQRILVADNTRPETQDGYVKAQNVLELTLSQNVVFDPMQTYVICVQHIDGTTENIAITAGSAKNKVVLGTAPRLPLAVDPTLYARCSYEIVGSASHGQRAFLVSSKNPQSNFSTDVSAVNYDARYYQNDADYINGIVDENGNPI